MSTNLKICASELSKSKGRTLTRIDKEQKMLTSGTLGATRLLVNIAIDFMEKHPSMSFEQAYFAAQAYCERTYN